MSQRISILFGELITDAAVQRANPLPPGVYEGFEPSLGGPSANGGWTVNLAPGPRSISIWRTAGLPYLGSHTIFEDGLVSVQVDGPSLKPRIDLVIGAHHWVEGPVDVATGYPVGTQTADMLAVYGVVKGTPDDTPQSPPVPNPYDVNGRRAVILAQILVPPAGAPTVKRWPQTDMRMGNRGLALGNATLNELGWHQEREIPPISRPVVVSDIGSLRVLSRLQHTALAIVAGSGIFQYDSGDTTADDGLVSIKPISAEGRWVRILASGGGTGDTQAPMFAGVTINGNTATAAVSDNMGVTRVEFFVDDTLNALVNAAPWTATLDLAGLTGLHALTAKAYDAAGNVAVSSSVAFTPGGSASADTQAPTVSASVSGTSGTISLSATASDNVGVAKVEFHVDGIKVGTLSAAPYAMSLESTALANGSHTLMAKGYDAAGNVGSSNTVAFAISNGPAADTTPPAISGLSTAQSGSEVELLADVTDAQSGVAKAVFLVDGIEVATLTSGPFRFYPVQGLSVGNHTFRVDATDAAGNASTKSKTFSVAAGPDVTGPVVSNLAATYLGNRTLRFTCTATDSAGVAKVDFLFSSMFAGTVDAPTSGNTYSLDFPYSWQLDGKTDVILVATAFDAAGNSGTAVISNVSIPLPDPTISNLRVTGTDPDRTLAVDMASPSQASKVVYTVVDPNGAPHPFNVMAAPWSQGFATTVVGTYSVSAAVVNIHGVTGPSIGPVTFTHAGDATAPAVFLSPADGSSLSGSVQVSASATDDVGATRLEVRIGGQVYASSDGAPLSFPLDTQILANGQHAITAIATDAAGNAGQVTHSVSVDNAVADTTNPTISISQSTDGAGRITFTANAADNVGVDHVAWAVDGASAGNGGALVADPSGFNTSSHAVQATAFDAAGNHASASATFLGTNTTGGGGGCFAPGTWVLMGNGRAKRIEEVRVGDRVLTIHERAHQSDALGDAPFLLEAPVDAILRHAGAFAMRKVEGIRATPEHPWGTGTPAWTPTEGLRAGAQVRGIRDGIIQWFQVESPAPDEVAPTVYNLTIRGARTYLVAAAPEGRYFLVHNIKIQTV